MKKTDPFEEEKEGEEIAELSEDALDDMIL